MNETVKVSTKTNKDAQAKETSLTINWDGMAEDDIRALARQSIVIAWQSECRDKKGTKKDPTPRPGHVPAEAAINATDYKVGTRVAKPVNIDAIFAKLTPEQQAAFLAARRG